MAPRVPLLTFDPAGSDRGDAVAVDLDRLVASRALLQANSGGGKSRALRYALEQTHGRVQHLVIDPEGEFASLRERFPYVLAGREGDVPADPKSAKLLCRRLMELGASAVLDLYDLKLPDRRRFVRLFLEELMHLPRALWRPLLVVIDEAHVFCPERGHGEAESTDAVITLCTQGRKRGYAPLLATQRLSKLNKDAAAELLNKLIGRTGLDVDAKRAGDELGFDKEQRQALRSLAPGTFYAFGPAIAAEVTLVRTGDVATSHPEAGRVSAPAPPAPAAVRALLGELRDLPQQAEAEARSLDELQAKVRELQGQLRRAQQGAPERVVERPVVDEAAIQRAVGLAQVEAFAAHRATLREMGERLGRVRRAPFSEAFTELEAAYAFLTTVYEGQPNPPRPPAARRAARTAAPAPVPSRAPAAAVTPSEGITAPQQRILDALLSFEVLGLTAVQKSNVAVFSDQSPTSSGFANNLGRLRSAGLIDYPAGGIVALTAEGRQHATTAHAIATLADLHQAWAAKLPRPQWAILSELIVEYPDAIERAELAGLAEQSPTSSGYANNLGALRSLGLIDYQTGRRVVATSLLFPEGLR